MPRISKEKNKEYYKKYYSLNKEKIYKRNLEWRRKNKKWVNSYNEKWVSENSDKRKESYRKHNKKRYKKWRDAVLEHYGSKCVCCGEDKREFLAIDHIFGGGTKHVKSIGITLTQWVFENNFPEGFRILCHNCNHSLGIYGYCPHRNLPDDVIEKGI